MIVKEIEKKEKSTAEVTVDVTAEEFEAAVMKAYLKVRGRISVPGFRKGKAPRKMIESMYGKAVFYEDAIDIISPDALHFAAEQEKLDLVGQPSLLDFNAESEETVTLKYLVSLYPEIKLGQYKGLAAPKTAVRITKKDVDSQIERVRKQNARIQDAARAAKSGDIVNIDFIGYVDGKAFEGGDGKEYDLELGSGQFIPGFEDQLIGTSAGDERDVNVTFPKDYSAPLAGADATFKVKVNAVKEKILPELDDEFAKDVSEFDTLEEYAASVKESLSEEKKSHAQQAFEDIIVSRLIEGCECDVPECMITDQVEQMISNFRYNLAGQGMELETYLQLMGMDIDHFRSESRATAESQIKTDLAFEAIAKVENFDISDEQVEDEYKRLADNYKIDIETIKKSVNADSIKQGLRIEAARKLVFDSAVAEKKEKKSEDASEKKTDK